MVSTDGTIAVWVKADTFDGHLDLEKYGQSISPIACSQANPPDVVNCLYYSNTSSRFQFTQLNGNGEVYTAVANQAGAPATGEWYFLVAWQQGTTLGIQVNGGTPDTATMAGTPLDRTVTFHVGRINAGAGYWDGLIDELGFWTRALTEEERTALWNDGDGCAYPFTACSGAIPSAINLLSDGNMEQYPTSSGWILTGEAGATFGRLTNNYFTAFLNGSPACGSGYQAIGRRRTLLPDLGQPQQFGPIQQGLDWGGRHALLPLSGTGPCRQRFHQLCLLAAGTQHRQHGHLPPAQQHRRGSGVDNGQKQSLPARRQLRLRHRTWKPGQPV